MIKIITDSQIQINKCTVSKKTGINGKLKCYIAFLKNVYS